MEQQDAASILASLQDHQTANPLSVLHLAEVILEGQQNLNKSDAQQFDVSSSTVPSNSDLESPTPQSLAADLAHYKDLFSKLRFSYLEQVTKEKYLRSIVGDPPLLVSHADNAALEVKVDGMKADLKAKKVEVDELVTEMEVLASELAGKYERVNRDRQVLETVPKEIEEMADEVEMLKAEIQAKRGAMQRSDDPRLNMGFEATQKALEEQKRKNAELDAQIEAIQRLMPTKIRECEKAERELEELERRRNESTRLAREVRRMKEEGGRDVLSEQGRWYKSSEIVMRAMLGTEA